MVRRPGEVFLTEQYEEPDDPVKTMKDLLTGGTEETFPPFRVGETQRLVELAHTVDGYERHDLEDKIEGEWWPRAKLREMKDAGGLIRFPTQELLDVLFCLARADRHGGGYGDWETIIYDIANEVRRRAIEGRKEDAAQEQLLRAITAIPPRPKKDPREIKILDPACGSGHFLLYCFALLLVIYEEAYDDPDLGSVLRDDYPTKNDMHLALPGLILRHNLHGIDIDLRCTQIAALALWLRCQRAYQEMGLKKDRPRITKSNIVCAEPMPGEGHILKEFVGQIEPKLLGQVVEVVFEKMKLAGEVGSLLKIEEEIRDTVSQARQRWRIGPVTTQMGLFGEQKPVDRQQRFDLSGITDSEFFEQAEVKVVDALRRFAEQAENGLRLQRRLFAEDAARGFGFVDICHKQFDAVLINPPFGKGSQKSDEYIRLTYPDNWKDLYAAFLERSITHFALNGLTGCISSSLFMYTKQLRALRAMWVEKRSLFCLVELGPEVLDTAAVETALTVTTSVPVTLTLFSDLTSHSDKSIAIKLAQKLDSQLVVFHKLSRFRNLFAYPFCYHMSDEKLALWGDPHRIDPDHATVALGNHTFDDERFLRLRWEVPANIINRKWFGYEKGGEYQPYFSSTPLLLNWGDGGRELRQFQIDRNGTDAQVMQSNSLWWKPGITYPRVSSVGFGPRAMPAGHIFGSESISIFPNDSSDTLSLLGFLCSSWAEDLIQAFGRYRKIENRAVSNLPLKKEKFQQWKLELEGKAQRGIKLLLRTESWDETTAMFVVPQRMPIISDVHSGQTAIDARKARSELALLAQETDLLVAHMMF